MSTTKEEQLQDLLSEVLAQIESREQDRTVPWDVSEYREKANNITNPPKEYAARVSVSRTYGVYVQARSQEEAEELVQQQVDECKDGNWTFKDGPFYETLTVYPNE